MDARTYLTLTSLPLLQGVSASDIHRLLDLTRLQIEALDPGELCIAAGEVSQQLTFLLDGEMEVVTTSPDGSYSLTERITGPAVLEPEVLFGIQRHWGSQYRSLTECHVMGIHKEDVSRMLVSIEVFRLNYLNLMSTLATRRKWQSWHPVEGRGSIEERFLQFVQNISLVKGGPKRLTIKATQLGQILGVHRAHLCEILADMQERGLLRHGRGYIDILPLSS